MHTDEFMIRVCLEVLLQYTHKKGELLYVKQNDVKEVFPKSFMQLCPSQNILRERFLLYAH